MRKIANLWSVLDTKKTLPEVIQFWESQVADLLFLTDAEEASTIFDDSSMIKKTTAIPAKSVPVVVSQSGDAEVVDCHYGLKLNGSSLFIRQFQQAELPPEHHETLPQDELLWIPSFPVSLNLVRNTIYKNPYSSIGFDFSLGIFGARHLEAAALAEVLREDLRTQGPSPRIEQMAEAAEIAAQKIKAWESKVDFNVIAKKLWDAALATATAMGPDGKLSALFLKEESSTPADLTIGSPGSQAPKIYQPDPQALIIETWTDRLSYGFEYQRAIRYFSNRRDTDLWHQVHKNCMRARKGTWPAVVEILSQNPVSDENLDQIIQFLADPNWPGASEAWIYILSLKEKAIPSIEASIARAKEVNDTDWVAHLEEVRDMIKTESDS